MSEENPVLVESAAGVMTITINRPKAKNAVNKAVAEGISAAIDELEANDELRVAILTGADGTFCSGMDLKAFVTGELPMVEGRGFAGLVEYLVKKPMIAVWSRVVSVSHRAQGAPKQPSRQVIRMPSGCRKLSNSEAITA